VTDRRKDAWDRALTDEQRDRVYERMATPGFRWADVATWLSKEYKIDAPSRTALYAFCTYWREHYLARKSEERILARDSLREQRAAVGDLSNDTIFHLETEAMGYIARGDLGAGQRLYSIAAKIRNDTRAAIELELKRTAEVRAGAALKLSQDKFQVEVCEKFLAWFKDDRARQIAESSATNSDKIAALRQAYFADVDAFEKSGELKLPS
jgi:hypothetical protein